MAPLVLDLYGPSQRISVMSLCLLGQGGVSSVAPWGFKRALGDLSEIFKHYGQQDSQELLHYLLDGLHEDLNRVKVKPYFEVSTAQAVFSDFLSLFSSHKSLISE